MTAAFSRLDRAMMQHIVLLRNKALPRGRLHSSPILINSTRTHVKYTPAAAQGYWLSRTTSTCSTSATRASTKLYSKALRIPPAAEGKPLGPATSHISLPSTRKHAFALAPLSSASARRMYSIATASQPQEPDQLIAASATVQSPGLGLPLPASMPMELSAEQRFLLQQVIHNKKSVFFTGSAGTGKSVLLRQLIEDLKQAYEPGQVAVTASTGIAACNIGGCTLHSFAGIGLGTGTVDQLVKKLEGNQRARGRWRKTKVLIIDEISMIDGELFDKLEELARRYKKSKKPFGGIQLIITGDFFQLPPVVVANDPLQQPRASSTQEVTTLSAPEPTATKTVGSRSTTTVIKGGSNDMFQEVDDIPFLESGFDVPLLLEDSTAIPSKTVVQEPTLCFDAKTWNSCIEYTLLLTEVFRQRDPAFIKMLTELRHGELTEETSRVFKQLEREPQYPDDGIQPTELFALRREVELANHRHLANLPGPVYVYNPQDAGPLKDRMGQLCIAPSRLQLKEDAQVMLIKNLSPTLVNGSMGIVVGFQQDYTVHEKTGQLVTSNFPVVRFAGEEYDLVIRPEEWKLELPDGEVLGSRTQVPLILAWAMSIHKSQGQTMERLKVDMGKIFEAGQAYVALSRATSLAGLQVLNFKRSSVKTHGRVSEFYDGLRTVQEVMEEEQAMVREKAAKKGKKSTRKSKKNTTIAATSELTKVAGTEVAMKSIHEVKSIPVAQKVEAAAEKPPSEFLLDKAVFQELEASESLSVRVSKQSAPAVGKKAAMDEASLPSLLSSSYSLLSSSSFSPPVSSFLPPPPSVAPAPLKPGVPSARIQETLLPSTAAPSTSVMSSVSSARIQETLSRSTPSPSASFKQGVASSKTQETLSRSAPTPSKIMEATEVFTSPSTSAYPKSSTTQEKRFTPTSSSASAPKQQDPWVYPASSKSYLSQEQRPPHSSARSKLNAMEDHRNLLEPIHSYAFVEPHQRPRSTLKLNGSTQSQAQSHALQAESRSPSSSNEVTREQLSGWETAQPIDTSTAARKQPSNSISAAQKPTMFEKRPVSRAEESRIESKKPLVSIVKRGQRTVTKIPAPCTISAASSTSSSSTAKSIKSVTTQDSYLAPTRVQPKQDAATAEPLFGSRWWPLDLMTKVPNSGSNPMTSTTTREQRPTASVSSPVSFSKPTTVSPQRFEPKSVPSTISYDGEWQHNGLSSRPIMTSSSRSSSTAGSGSGLRLRHSNAASKERVVLKTSSNTTVTGKPSFKTKVSSSSPSAVTPIAAISARTSVNADTSASMEKAAAVITDTNMKEEATANANKTGGQHSGWKSVSSKSKVRSEYNADSSRTEPRPTNFWFKSKWHYLRKAQAKYGRSNKYSGEDRSNNNNNNNKYSSGKRNSSNGNIDGNKYNNSNNSSSSKS